MSKPLNHLDQIDKRVQEALRTFKPGNPDFDLPDGSHLNLKPPHLSWEMAMEFCEIMMNDRPAGADDPERRLSEKNHVEFVL